MNTYFPTPSQIILKINTACFLTAYVTEETKTTTVPPDSPTRKPTDDREVFPTDDYSQPDLDPGTICRISAENCGSIKFFSLFNSIFFSLFLLKKRWWLLEGWWSWTHTPSDWRQRQRRRWLLGPYMWVYSTLDGLLHYWQNFVTFKCLLNLSSNSKSCNWRVRALNTGTNQELDLEILGVTKNQTSEDCE